MKRKLYHLVILFLLIFIGDDVNAQAPAWEWAKSAAGSSYEYAVSVAVDASGNSYVTGYFYSDTITFGTISLTRSDQNSSDIFIAKYDAGGNVIWAKSAGGDDYDWATSITVDALGNSYVVGYSISHTITFDTITLTNVLWFDMFIAKYDSNGNVVWAKRAGKNDHDVAYSVATDSAGNVYMAGYYGSYTITFDTITLTNYNYYPDMFLVKYNSNGNALWAKSGVGAYIDGAYSLAVDASGNSYVAGYFRSDTITFDTTILINANATTSDMFIAKYDSGGNLLWAKSAGGNGDDGPQSIAIDKYGNAFVAGYYESDTITFGTTTLTNANVDTANMLIVKYDSNGNVLWANSQVVGAAIGPQDDGKYAVATDTAGNCYVAGAFDYGSLTFGPYIITNFHNVFCCWYEIFIVKYDAGGNVSWAISEGGRYSEQPYSIAVNSSGVIYVAGYFNSDTVVFGPDTLNNLNPAYDDVLVAKLDSIITGIQFITPNKNLPIYPNPTTNLLHLTLTKPLSPNTIITITDMQGRVVKAKMLITPGGDAIDVSALTYGVYLLKVNGQVQRFVKM